MFVSQRKQDSDRIRATLTVLKRYRFLFSLVGSIKKNIENQDGQYDKVTHTSHAGTHTYTDTQVIRDYKKAKALVISQKTNGAQLLRRVHEEIFKIIGKHSHPDTHTLLHSHTHAAKFRQDLLQKLDNPRAYLEDQQRIIGALSHHDTHVLTHTNAQVT